MHGSQPCPGAGGWKRKRKPTPDQSCQVCVEAGIDGRNGFDSRRGAEEKPAFQADRDQLEAAGFRVIVGLPVVISLHRL